MLVSRTPVVDGRISVSPFGKVVGRQGLGTISKAAVTMGLVTVAAGVGYYLYERNTEQPGFKVSLRDGQFELREYPALLVAEAVQSGTRSQSLNLGFRTLADYIFGKSRSGEKISMTAPVVQDAVENGRWRTRFVMPAKYTRATLPAPPDGVSINEIPSRKVAVTRFSGSSEDPLLAAHEAELRQWVAANKLRVVGEAEYAFYNSPFIPAFLRHNEILIPVAEPR